MHLAEGYTRCRDVIVPSESANELRRLNRRLRNRIDARRPTEVQQALQEMKGTAGDDNALREIFEIYRREAADRWQTNFGTSWSEDVKRTDILQLGRNDNKGDENERRV